MPTPHARSRDEMSRVCSASDECFENAGSWAVPHGENHVRVGASRLRTMETPPVHAAAFEGRLLDESGWDRVVVVDSEVSNRELIVGSGWWSVVCGVAPARAGQCRRCRVLLRGAG